jgi:hypothetical protein
MQQSAEVIEAPPLPLGSDKVLAAAGLWTYANFNQRVSQQPPAVRLKLARGELCADLAVTDELYIVDTGAHRGLGLSHSLDALAGQCLGTRKHTHAQGSTQ